MPQIDHDLLDWLRSRAAAAERALLDEERDAEKACRKAAGRLRREEARLEAQAAVVERHRQQADAARAELARRQTLRAEGPRIAGPPHSA